MRGGPVAGLSNGLRRPFLADAVMRRARLGAVVVAHSAGRPETRVFGRCESVRGLTERASRQPWWGNQNDGMLRPMSMMRLPARWSCLPATQDKQTPVGRYVRSVCLNRRDALVRHRDGTHLAAPLGTTKYAKALLWPLYLEGQTMRLIALALAAAAVMTTGCTRNEPEPDLSFTQAELIAGNKLKIGVLPCLRNLLETSVDETADTVTVTVTSGDYPAQAPDCGSMLTVQLNEPFVDGRKLIDGVTGQEVRVERGLEG